MWAVYSLLALLGLLVALVLALLLIPVFGRFAYAGELSARLRVLGIPLTLYPVPEKQPKKRKKQPKKVKKAKKSQPKKAEKPSKWQDVSF